MSLLYFIAIIGIISLAAGQENNYEATVLLFNQGAATFTLPPYVQCANFYMYLATTQTTVYCYGDDDSACAHYSSYEQVYANASDQILYFSFGNTDQCTTQMTCETPAVTLSPYPQKDLWTAALATSPNYIQLNQAMIAICESFNAAVPHA